MFLHLWPTGSLPSPWVPLGLKTLLGSYPSHSSRVLLTILIATRARALQWRTFQLCFLPDATHTHKSSHSVVLTDIYSKGNCIEFSVFAVPGPICSPEGYFRKEAKPQRAKEMLIFELLLLWGGHCLDCSASNEISNLG